MSREWTLKRQWHAIERAGDLSLPRLELSSNGCDLWIASAIVLLGVSIWIGSFGWFMVGALAWFLLFPLMPSAVPREFGRMDHLSRAVLAYNYGKLSREHGCVHRDDLWRALVTVVRDHSGTGYRGIIDRNTVFFDSQLDKPRG